MTNDNYTPWPEGYEVCEIAEIAYIAYKSETRQAIILFTSTTGQKVCLISDLAALNQAVLQIQTDSLQTHAAEGAAPTVIKDDKLA
jgi:hypothetical protein